MRRAPVAARKGGPQRLGSAFGTISNKEGHDLSRASAHRQRCCALACTKFQTSLSSNASPFSPGSRVVFRDGKASAFFHPAIVWEATRQVRSAARRLRRSRVTACRISALRAAGTPRRQFADCRHTHNLSSGICCRPAGVWPLRITRPLPHTGQTTPPSFGRLTPETRPVLVGAPLVANHYPSVVH